MVCEPLTANALEPDHETGLKPRAIAARRRHSASMRPAPITADKHCSSRFANAVGNPTLYTAVQSTTAQPRRTCMTPCVHASLTHASPLVPMRWQQCTITKASPGDGQGQGLLPRSRGEPMCFWDGRSDPFRNAQRVMRLKSLFERKYPSWPQDIGAPACGW